ncbi:13578_t:CDS:2 [Entrophospora sp. SA101]|nr:13578_t:CDS:2 [Entrophospora sp. SA101]
MQYPNFSRHSQKDIEKTQIDVVKREAIGDSFYYRLANEHIMTETQIEGDIEDFFNAKG